MNQNGERRMSRREALKITAVTGVSLAIGGSVLAGLVQRGRLHRVAVRDIRMGTLVHITVVHPDPSAAREMVDAAFAEMERLEAILSRHRPDTAVSRLNREGSLRSAPLELSRLVRLAGEYSEATEGAFDITVAPVLHLYASSFENTGQPPSDAELNHARELVGHHSLRAVESDLLFDEPGMAVTLDGIAKGFIVDRAVERLVAAGADRVMVDAGGDMASRGTSAPGEPWSVGIQDPWDGRGRLGSLHLRSQGIGSSGDYVHRFSEDRRFHHIIDPRTGKSPDHTSAVTVVASTAVEADALSTAALVLGPEEGIALLEAREGIEGLLVTKDRTEIRTRGFATTLT